MCSSDLQLLVLLLAAGATAFAPSARMARAPTAKMALVDDAKAAAVAVAIGASMAFAPAAHAADIGAGEQIFSGNCAACHAGGNNVIQGEKTLRIEALKEYLAGGASTKSVVTQVTNGKNAMPAFGGRLGDDEIEDVAAYVISTASSSGW